MNGFINVKTAKKVSNSHKDNGYTIKSVTQKCASEINIAVALINIT